MASGAGQAGDVVRFGVFEADLRTHELRRRGSKVPLQEQPFQLLAVLLQRAGDLVTREELRARLWPGSVFVDFEHGLNKAVNKVRHALGDPAENPRFVETLSRRGYRFIAPVERAPTSLPSGFFRLIWDARTFVLTEGDNIIGRDAAAAVTVDSSTVSRHHARIRIRADTATVEDLGSKNGTFLGERRVDSPCSLADGDEIRVGSVQLTFRAAAGATSTQTAR